jgi:hypothetical protein
MIAPLDVYVTGGVGGILVLILLVVLILYIVRRL